MQSLRVGVTAGRFSPKIRPNRFLGFSRGFHFLVMNKEQVDQEGLKTRGDILKAVNDLYDESSREDALTGR